MAEALRRTARFSAFNPRLAQKPRPFKFKRKSHNGANTVQAALSKIQRATIAGFDVGATSLKLALGGLNLRPYDPRSQNPFVDFADPFASMRTDGSQSGALLHQIAAEIKKLAAGREITAVGGSVAAIVNNRTGVITDATNIPGLKSGEYPLAELLSQELGGIPVYIDNDANCGARGEFRFGSWGHRYPGLKNTREQSLVFVSVSTGVGSGIVHRWAPVDGLRYDTFTGQPVFRYKTINGHDNKAGETGHLEANFAALRDRPEVLLTKPEEARLREIECGCGGSGCVELFGGAKLPQVVRALYPELSHDHILNTYDPFTAREIMQHSGWDPVSKRTLKMAAIVMAAHDRQLMQTLNPTFLIHGGSMAMDVAFQQALMAEFIGTEKANRFFIHKPVNELAAPYGNTLVGFSGQEFFSNTPAPVAGAIALALEKLEEPFFQ